MIPTVHKYNMLIPSPPNLTPESTTPLRINKRVLISPPVAQFFPKLTKRHPHRHLHQFIPRTTNGLNDTIDISDVQVRLGLSLLRDIAKGMDSSIDDGTHTLFRIRLLSVA